MNNTINELTERKSVRVYTEQTISPEMKKAILEAAVQAPTAGNQQLYTILDITSQELKETLSETCDHQPFIAKAQMVLIFCADCQKWYDAYKVGNCMPRKPEAGDLMLAVTDAAIAAQNAVTAAHSLGDWFLLYRRYYGTMRTSQRTITAAFLCISSCYVSIWLSYRTAKAT